MAENNEKVVTGAENSQNLNYDFNFENQVENKEETVVAPPPEAPKLVRDEVDPNAVADPAIGKVNPNPVKPENVVPVDIDFSAGLEAKKEEDKISSSFNYLLILISNLLHFFSWVLNKFKSTSIFFNSL